MVYLTSAVILVGLVASLNLLLLVGVIRRLRQHTDHLNGLLAGSSGVALLPVGEVVSDFVATTTDGQPVARHLLPERTLIGFFSPDCSACRAQLPSFTELADRMGSRRTIVVVAAVTDQPGQEEQEYLSRLAGAGQVVREVGVGPLQEAFQVSGFPSFYVLDTDATVIASGYAAADVSQAVVSGRVAV